ncbi:MAG TPA: hypothetical protein VH682_11930 [Gemmataceae bacterium]|jgi:hypothetical protein
MADKINVDTAKGRERIGELIVKHTDGLLTPSNGNGMVNEKELVRRLKRFKYGGSSVQITVPTTSPTWTGPVGVNFQIQGTDANLNVVEGSMTDLAGGAWGPFDNTPTGASSPYKWTIPFNNPKIDPNHTLFVYVFDTNTCQDASLTIYTTASASESSKVATCHHTLPFTPIIDVTERLYAKGVPEQDIPEREQDIPVKVTHPECTRGCILLILRKSGDSPASIIKTHRLEPSTQTTCTFRGIKMGDWDLIMVAAVAEGVPEGAPIVPVVLKKP